MLQDKVFVVSGGAGVLGGTIIATLAGKGATVASIDMSGRDRVANAALVVGSLDVTNFEAVQAAMTSIQTKFGRIDGLVNVAGTFRWETVEDGSIATWDLLFSANVKTAVVASKAVLPHLLMSKGGIVNIGANAAMRGAAGMAPYTASKAGVGRFTESLADEVKERGMRVNAILPSIIDTPQNRADMAGADYSRWVTTEQIAEVAAFLLSPAASGITGACIPVTGLV